MVGIGIHRGLKIPAFGRPGSNPGIPTNYSMMSKLKFYIEKIGFLAAFIWWWRWALVRDEWNLTHKQLEDAEARIPDIEREALERILGIIKEHEENSQA